MQRIFDKKIFSKWFAGMLVVTMFIPALLTFSVPHKAAAQAAVTVDPPNLIQNIGQHIEAAYQTIVSSKSWYAAILKQIAMHVAEHALTKLTESTIGWINGGFEGNPLFVQDPKLFFKNIADIEVREAVNAIGYDPTKFKFGKDVARQIVLGYVDQTTRTLQDRLTYHPELQPPQNSWQSILHNVTDPANNPFGAYITATKDVLQKAEEKKAAADKELVQNHGFLSMKECVKKSVGPAVQAGVTPPASTEPDCLEYKTTTPGGIVGDQVTRALGSKFSQTELGAQLGGDIAAVFDTLISKLANDGLSKISNAVSGNNQQQAQDNWNYMGLTLAGPTDDVQVSGGNVNWNMPDQVIDIWSLLRVDNPSTHFANEAAGTVFSPTEAGGTLQGLDVTGSFGTTGAGTGSPINLNGLGVVNGSSSNIQFNFSQNSVQGSQIYDINSGEPLPNVQFNATGATNTGSTTGTGTSTSGTGTGGNTGTTGGTTGCTTGTGIPC